MPPFFQALWADIFFLAASCTTGFAFASYEWLLRLQEVFLSYGRQNGIKSAIHRHEKLTSFKKPYLAAFCTTTFGLPPALKKLLRIEKDILYHIEIKFVNILTLTKKGPLFKLKEYWLLCVCLVTRGLRSPQITLIRKLYFSNLMKMC